MTKDAEHFEKYFLALWFILFGTLISSNPLKFD